MSDLNSAFHNTWVNARSFMMNAFNLTEDEVITAVTTVADFGVTQVVDGECSAPVQCPCSAPLCSAPVTPLLGPCTVPLLNT